MLKFNKYIILLNFVLMLAMPKIGTANNAILTKISFSFEFNQGSEVLEIDYTQHFECKKYPGYLLVLLHRVCIGL